MKTHNHLYGRICEFGNLLAAAKAASRNKRFQHEVGAFNTERETELLRLREELLRQTYRPGPYREKWIQVPKERMISVAPFRDRVVHHALCRVVMPLFEKKMIHDLYSNRKGKGTHAAIRRCQELSRQHRFVLKCDIAKYFPSIDHELLKATIRRTIVCKETLWLLDMIIDRSNPQAPVCTLFPGDDLVADAGRRLGLPLGNLTSQWLGNGFLSPFDHWVQEELRCGTYIRYVDDFLLFSDNKTQLREWRAAIRSRLLAMRLRLNERKSRIHPVAEGVSFLGQRIWPDRRRLLSANVRTAKRRFRSLGKSFMTGQVDREAVQRRWASWRGHALQAEAWPLVRSMVADFRMEMARQGQIGDPAGRRVEQQHEQPPVRQSQQQQSRQRQQQYRVPLCEGDLTATGSPGAGGRNGAVYGPLRRPQPKAHLTRPVLHGLEPCGTNTRGEPGASSKAYCEANVPGSGRINTVEADAS